MYSTYKERELSMQYEFGSKNLPITEFVTCNSSNRSGGGGGGGGGNGGGTGNSGGGN